MISLNHYLIKKKIEMIDSANINYGGGNLHCITMNVPKL